MYVNGSPIRQEILEGSGLITGSGPNMEPHRSYMGAHQHDPNVNCGCTSAT